MVPATERSTLFLDAYPSYATTRALDELRAAEYPELEAQHHTYLDFTAANLYATSQIDRHHALLRTSIFGNPHSTNPTSSLATEYVARARRERAPVLQRVARRVGGHLHGQREPRAEDRSASRIRSDRAIGFC